MTCGEIFKYIESWAPEEIAWNKDNVGLQVGSAERKVKNILLALDLNMKVITEAIKKDSAPKSIKRGMAVAASLVCKVEKTK